MQALLEEAGARVQVAASTGEAFTSAVEGLPDALIIDPVVSDHDGYGLWPQIKEALGPRAPRVAIALAPAGPRRDTAADAFHRYVSKPVDPNTLVRLLEDLLAPDTRA